jgi:membrane protein
MIMSMQQYPRNPIEQRKRAVRTYFRNGVVSVAGGVAGGILLSIITQASFWLFLGMIIAVVGGFVNYRRVRRIINHRD